MMILKLAMQNEYKNIEDYKPGKNVKVLIAFDDTILRLITTRLNPVVTEFIRGR